MSLEYAVTTSSIL